MGGARAIGPPGFSACGWGSWVNTSASVRLARMSDHTRHIHRDEGRRAWAVVWRMGPLPARGGRHSPCERAVRPKSAIGGVW
jgi:hypothetical protein